MFRKQGVRDRNSRPAVESHRGSGVPATLGCARFPNILEYPERETEFSSRTALFQTILPIPFMKENCRLCLGGIDKRETCLSSVLRPTQRWLGPRLEKV